MSCFLFSQEITVLDFDTEFPVGNCTIYAENNPKVIYTNKKGKADISIFADNDIISFNHITYIEVEVLKRQISQTNNIIYLHRNAEALDEVVLSSTRQKESKSRIAEHIEINQIEEIRKISPQTSADLLANLPGIKVQKSQFGGGSPVLRGMEANRVLLVVDGVRMNNAIYRSGHLQSSITVSPSILERTEVIFGPSSVAYGSDALGGVIHYYTKTPKISQKDKVELSFMSRYSSVNEEKTNQGSVEISFKKWASLSSFSYSDFGDLKMGKKRRHGYENWGKVFEYSNNSENFYNPLVLQNSDPNIQRNTGYNQLDFLQKFNIKLNDKTDLILNFQHSNSSNIPRFDKLTERSGGELKFAEWYYGPQKRILLSSQLSIKPDKRWLKRGTITAAYQNLNESRVQRKFGSLERLNRKEDVDVFELNGDFSVLLTKNSNRNLSYGFEIAHNKVNSISYGDILSVNDNDIVGVSANFAVQSRYPDGGSTYTSSAIYANYRQDITAKSTLNTGIRLTNTNLNAKWIDETFISLPKNDISLKNSAVTATIGYIYKPNDNWQFNSVLSSGFRSPNIDDIGKIREKSGRVSVPNIDLKPEYVYNAEIGILKYLNNKKFNIGFNVYYTLFHNYIARQDFIVNGSPTILYDGDVTETYANVNNKNAYIVGSTFSFRGKLSEKFKTKGSVTYTKGKSYDTKQPLSSIPPLFGNIEVGYGKDKFEIAAKLRFNGTKKINGYNLVEGIDNVEQSPYNESTENFQGTPSWYTLNFYSKYKVSNSLDLQFMVDNIFDNHYKEFASAISAPGRNFSISVLIN
ncbi:TonB-dependent receptor plug domain-containing protein [Urechidicola croceus]|nr:TonB-dependent receptor [Urechidicola croceus]